MTHPDSQELHRYADGEISQRRSRKVAAHLEGCSECTDEIRRIRATGDLVRQASEELVAEAPLEGFADRVMARIEVDEQPLPWTARLRTWLGEFFRYRRRVWAPSLGLAVAAAAAVLLAIGLRQPDPVPPPQTAELPSGTTVLSVSFGSSVNGTVFEVEDKDGSTTAVIWVDNAKSMAEDNTGAFRFQRRGERGAKHS